MPIAAYCPRGVPDCVYRKAREPINPKFPLQNFEYFMFVPGRYRIVIVRAFSIIVPVRKNG